MATRSGGDVDGERILPWQLDVVVMLMVKEFCHGSSMWW